MLQEDKTRAKKASGKKKATQAKTRTTRKKPPAAESEKSSQPAARSGQRHQMIAERAYFIAEQRGFSGGNAVEDWLSAEAQIDGKMLNGGT